MQISVKEGSMLNISDFTKREIGYFLENCNFTSRERQLFLLRNEEKSLEECAEIMNVSNSTVSRVSRKMNNKINREKCFYV